MSGFRLSTLIISLVFLQGSIFAQNLDSLIVELESNMGDHKTYDLQKEKRIDNLLKKRNQTDDLKEVYKLYDEVYEEYEFYNFDNALNYIEENIQIAERLNIGLNMRPQNLNYETYYFFRYYPIKITLEKLASSNNCWLCLWFMWNVF